MRDGDNSITRWQVRGLRIRELRHRENWTQEDLATQAEISVRTLSRYESGEEIVDYGAVRSVEKVESLQNIAMALKVDRDELLEALPQRWPTNAAVGGEPATPLITSGEFQALHSREYVNRVAEEQHARTALTQEKGPLVVYSPDDFGKSTFLSYLLSEVTQRHSLPRSSPRIIRNFLEPRGRSREVTVESVIRPILLKVVSPEVDSESKPTQVHDEIEFASLLRLFNEYIENLDRPLFLTMEKLDSLDDLIVVRELLMLARSWVEQASAGSDGRALRLIMTTGTCPVYLEDPLLTSSFFDLCTQIWLRALSLQQVTELVQSLAVSAKLESIHSVYERIGGHPLLWQQVLRRVRLDGGSLTMLSAECIDGIILGYIHRKYRWLVAQGIEDPFRQILMNGSLDADGLTRARLMRSGLFDPGSSDVDTLKHLRHLEVLTPAIRSHLVQFLFGANQ